MKFEELVNEESPTVFIFATCYSYFSEINGLLHSSGLISALNVSKERGDITNGKIFKLDDEQKDFLKKITENLIIKDIIIAGKISNI